MPPVSPSKYRVEAGWDDAPHLGEKEKSEMLAATPLHLRDARSKGIPSMGAGAIYPFAVESIRIDPFPLPPHFRRGFSLDDGWNVTAVGFFAYDPDMDILYQTAELYLKEHKPEEVAAKIKTRGDWMPGVGDAAAKARDGVQVIDIYNRYLPKLILADKGVEAGIYDVTMRLGSGGSRFSRRASTRFGNTSATGATRTARSSSATITRWISFATPARPVAMQRMIAKPAQTILPSRCGLGGGDASVGY
jgi:hypothetical protein